jgi:hypothetical protein
VVGALLVVSAVLVGSGLTIVSLTEQRDKRDADADLRRFVGNLMPSVAGALGLAPPPPLGPPPLSGPGLGELHLLDRNDNALRPPTGARPPLGAVSNPNPAVVQALVDAFNQRGHSSSPAGQIVFVRALATMSGAHLTLGAVPRGFPPMSQRVGGRSLVADGSPWRLEVVRGPMGVVVEVAALARTIALRAARLRRS